jgi:hypothetical protein
MNDTLEPSAAPIPTPAARIPASAPRALATAATAPARAALAPTKTRPSSAARLLAGALAFVTVLGAALAPRPAFAHLGPPFPILMDQRLDAYVVSVWADPNIDTASTFYVVLEAPAGRRLPTTTRVRIGVQPVSKRLPEVIYDTAPQPVHEGARYMTTVQFDSGGQWRTRVFIDGSPGGGTLVTEVEPTPAGVIGPIGLLIFGFPFVGVGFLWLKATLRRRAPPPEAPAPAA